MCSAQQLLSRAWSSIQRMVDLTPIPGKSRKAQVWWQGHILHEKNDSLLKTGLSFEMLGIEDASKTLAWFVTRGCVTLGVPPTVEGGATRWVAVRWSHATHLFGRDFTTGWGIRAEHVLLSWNRLHATARLRIRATWRLQNAGKSKGSKKRIFRKLLDLRHHRCSTGSVKTRPRRSQQLVALP